MHPNRQPRLHLGEAQEARCLSSSRSSTRFRRLGSSSFPLIDLFILISSLLWPSPPRCDYPLLSTTSTPLWEQALLSSSTPRTHIITKHRCRRCYRMKCVQPRYSQITY